MPQPDRRPSASVLTLVRGRQDHLDGLVDGLTQQTCGDFELIIASMQPVAPRISPALPFPVRTVHVPGDKLPLAAARNAAAALASTDRLIFLDVDCIPSPELVESFIQQLDASGRCLLGEVRYLPGKLPEQTTKTTRGFDDLKDCALLHPARPALPSTGWIDEPNPRALWGLSFALSKNQYYEAGGMDENYVGYGGEETDFAEHLAACGVRLGWCSNALSLHQYHAVYSPPLDRFDDIIANATRFYAKWGSWCMEYWLSYFVSFNLVEWEPTSKEIKILRRPSQADILNCRQPAEVAFA